MSSLYLETSAVLAWLFGEPESKAVSSAVEDVEMVATSVLTLMESGRAMIRAESQRLIKPAERKKLQGLLARAAAGWHVMEVTSEVQKRTMDSFPVEPLRTLDAIHLATALEFLEALPDMTVLSLDQRIVSNLEPLGLDACLPNRAR